MARTVLILWDIDHTLITTGGVGSEVYETAFKEATGRHWRRWLKFPGAPNQ